MAISVNESDDANDVTICITGRFDFTCHQAFAEAYQAYPKNKKRFVVDLAGTEYMDSSAMGMLLQLREHSAGELGNVSLINTNESVHKILAIANFDKLFDLS